MLLLYLLHLRATSLPALELRVYPHEIKLSINQSINQKQYIDDDTAWLPLP